MKIFAREMCARKKLTNFMFTVVYFFIGHTRNILILILETRVEFFFFVSQEYLICVGNIKFIKQNRIFSTRARITTTIPVGVNEMIFAPTAVADIFTLLGRKAIIVFVVRHNRGRGRRTRVLDENWLQTAGI